MTDEILIFKDKQITGDDLEITFHTDFTYNYNESEFPVVWFKLSKCKHLDKVDFKELDYYNDGITVDLKKNDSGEVFTATDMGGITVTIECEKIYYEKREYRKKDLIDIIKNLQRQVDDNHGREDKLVTQREVIRTYLTKEIETTNIKLTQADWLTEQKKQFLNGHLTTLRKMIELIEHSEK
jgi:hypothetical protein